MKFFYINSEFFDTYLRVSQFVLKNSSAQILKSLPLSQLFPTSLRVTFSEIYFGLFLPVKGRAETGERKI